MGISGRSYILLLGFIFLLALRELASGFLFFFGLPSLIGLAILPHITTKPLVQEVVSSITPVHQQSVPMPQVSSRERELYDQSRQAQIEAQRLRQQLANQAQLTQQLQGEVAQKQISDAALAQKQQELAVAQQEKEELEAKLAEAEKKTPIVQNITYNIQDSAISGDITNKIKNGKGSAIFIHITKNYKKTLGCVAIKKKDMLILLKLVFLGLGDHPPGWEVM